MSRKYKDLTAIDEIVLTHFTELVEEGHSLDDAELLLRKWILSNGGPNGVFQLYINIKEIANNVRRAYEGENLPTQMLTKFTTPPSTGG